MLLYGEHMVLCRINYFNNRVVERKIVKDENTFETFPSCVGRTFVELSLVNFIKLEGVLGDTLFSEQP